MKTLLRSPRYFRPKALGSFSCPQSQRLHQSACSRGSSFAAATSVQHTPTLPPAIENPHSPVAPTPPPLSLLALPTLIRSYLISTISASPVLLGPALRLLSLLVHSKYSFFQVEHNRLLRYIVKNTIYAQFCAGETPSEVQGTIANLKRVGFDGVVLNYAKEIIVDKAAPVGHVKTNEAEDVMAWKQGMLDTLKLVTDRDYVASK